MVNLLINGYTGLPAQVCIASENHSKYAHNNTLGKSRKARMENPGFYSKMNNKWWEHYEDEEAVLIEDIGNTHIWMGDFLKIWADRYGFRAEIKNASVVLRPKRIIVTSNYHPRELWPDVSVHDPLLRRFQIIHLTEKFVMPKTVKPALVRTQPQMYTSFTSANNGTLEPYIEPAETVNKMFKDLTDSEEYYRSVQTPEQSQEEMVVEKPKIPLFFTPEKPRIDAATHWTRCNMCKHLHCDCTCIINVD